MIRVEHQIQNWKNWATELDAAIRAFRFEHEHWPDIVSASPATLRRVALAATAKPDHVRDGQGRKPEGFAPIRRFATEEYDVPIVEEPDMPQDVCALVLAERG